MEQVVYILAESCGLRASGLRLLRLPLRARDPGRLVSLLRPGFLGSRHVWLVEEGGRKLLLLAPPGDYGVRWARRWRSDPLSGLRLKLAEAEGLVNGKVVWSVRWRRGYYEALFHGVERLWLETCRTRSGIGVKSLVDLCRLLSGSTPPRDP